MRIPFEKDKKRIVLLDKDLDTVPPDQLKLFMKKVIGRHYDNLKNRGSGWTFPAFQEPSLLEWIESLDSPLPQSINKPEVEKEDKAVQCDPNDLLENFRYRYDVDPALYAFGRKWLE